MPGTPSTGQRFFAILKFWGGEIHEIEALGYRDQYDADSPWPTTEGPGADQQE
jgi:hypothetical protein